MDKLDAALTEFHNQTTTVETEEALFAFLQEDSSNLHHLIERVRQFDHPIGLLNRMATRCFEAGLHEVVIPLLEEALAYEAGNADTLFNLASVLHAYGEPDMAIRFLEQIVNKDDEVHGFLNQLRKQSLETLGVQSVDQDNVIFTGERLVINKAVKETHSDVLDEHLRRYELACQYVKDKVVLDAACGAGYGSKMMANAGAKQVLGIDISPESVRDAIPLYADERVSFAVGDVHALPFDDETFDVVVSFETIEHIPNGAAWVAESARVLKPGGLFIVSTPNRRATNPGSYLEEAPLNPYHRFEYNTTDFLGDLLVHYDLVSCFGQTMVPDFHRPENQFLRIMHRKDVHYVPRVQTPNVGHQLVPFHQVKNAEPVYLVAVGRKK